MTDKPNLWMPLYVGDYLRDTRQLTLEEHGAYLLLIMEYWMTGPLPDDDIRLCRVLGCSIDAWRNAPSNAPSNATGISQASLRASLEQFFTIEDGFWRHARIDAERETALGQIKARKSKAKAGAAARWGKQEKCSTDATGNAPSNAPSIPSGNAPSPSQSPYVEDDGNARANPHLETDRQPAPNDLTQLTSDVCRRGGVRHIDPAQIIRNNEIVREWLEGGVAPETILSTVSEAVRDATEPIHSLRYFDASIRRSHALSIASGDEHDADKSRRRTKRGRGTAPTTADAVLAARDRLGLTSNAMGSSGATLVTVDGD